VKLGEKNEVERSNFIRAIRERVRALLISGFARGSGCAGGIAGKILRMREKHGSTRKFSFDFFRHKKKCLWSCSSANREVVYKMRQSLNQNNDGARGYRLLHKRKPAQGSCDVA